MSSPEEPGSTDEIVHSPAPDDREEVNLIFILGLVSIPVAMLGPVAFYLGQKYVTRCREEGIEPEQNAVIGMYIGLVMGIVFLIALVVACAGLAMIAVWMLFVLFWFFITFFFGFVMLLA